MPGSFVDPYKDPQSDVLRNKVGLRNAEALKTFEYEQSAARSIDLRDNHPVHGQFDLSHLKAIHKALFQDVYDWAGELRTINISKGSSSFTKAGQLDAIGARLADNLRRDNQLQNLPKDRFVDRLAHHYAE
ncbi:Fic family protein [Aquincola sp. S2]|uniref:protein adenylyltransferase n=1 Tax=Pseudaquabacterium terrae TaxID=2732868 RepID=A0ABX2ERP1_9BURK|nr:Fic family protein [Aquabacterium terrae]NRF71400.1 Fic family protein [Aquabacterium terrae]